ALLESAVPALEAAAKEAEAAAPTARRGGGGGGGGAAAAVDGVAQQMGAARRWAQSIRKLRSSGQASQAVRAAEAKIEAAEEALAAAHSAAEAGATGRRASIAWQDAAKHTQDAQEAVAAVAAADETGGEMGMSAEVTAALLESAVPALEAAAKEAEAAGSTSSLHGTTTGTRVGMRSAFGFTSILHHLEWAVRWTSSVQTIQQGAGLTTSTQAAHSILKAAQEAVIGARDAAEEGDPGRSTVLVWREAARCMRAAQHAVAAVASAAPMGGGAAASAELTVSVLQGADAMLEAAADDAAVSAAQRDAEVRAR
ncbi:hypothetical protein CYMTET_33748, partial [Cymbomonas tetramitiformis]